jgi:hypothetical protein
MDEIIVNTFLYITVFLDPENEYHKEGKSEITPDILEEKLRNVQEIVSYVNRYRNRIK